MTKIYLIRHGESEWNKLKKVQGQVNTQLTELGKIQAKAMGNRLIKENIDIIYTSDLSRAFDTAKIIGKTLNRPINITESIREINFGVWEGLTNLEVQQKYKDQYNIWIKNPEKLNLNGAENLESLKNRVMLWTSSILQENMGKNIAIVSHSATLKVLLLSLLDIPLYNYKNFSISNLGLNIIELRQYNNVLIKFNDISHLEGLL